MVLQDNPFLFLREAIQKKSFIIIILVVLWQINTQDFTFTCKLIIFLIKENLISLNDIKHLLTLSFSFLIYFNQKIFSFICNELCLYYWVANVTPAGYHHIVMTRHHKRFFSTQGCGAAFVWFRNFIEIQRQTS